MVRKRRYWALLFVCILLLTTYTGPVQAQGGLLLLGSTGPEVAQVQRMLAERGYDPGPVDGIFGPRTRQAVISFQEAHGLARDGIVGPLTLAALKSAGAQPGRSERAVLSGRKVVVDPGHGGPNPGAVGASGTREADNVLAIGLSLAQMLKAAGADVVLTRDADVQPRAPQKPSAGQLEARVLVANASGAHLFVSIHNNAHRDRSISGMMTFYLEGDATGKAIARVMQEELVKATGMKDRGIHGARFYVLRNTKMPAVLVEAGFISNAGDERLLQDPAFRRRVAEGIFRGIVRYFNGS